MFLSSLTQIRFFASNKPGECQLTWFVIGVEAEALSWEDGDHLWPYVLLAQSN